MSTALPRLQVTLNAEQRRVLKKAAAVNGTSQSKILAELLDAATPVLIRLIAAVENVAKLDQEKREVIRRTLDKAQAEAEKNAATALAILERIAAPPAGQRGAQPASDPPTVDLAAARRKHRRPPSANRGGEK